MTSFPSLLRKICTAGQIGLSSNRPLPRHQRGYEQLERRELLTISFQFDYSLDTNNFFSSQTRKDMLVYAGKLLGQRLSDSLAAITPSGSNTWSTTISNPATGAEKTFKNLSVKANTIIVYVGGRNISALGVGGSGSSKWSGSSSWGQTVTARGQSGVGGSSPTDVAPKVGSIVFDSQGTKWHFSRTTSGLDNGETDFVSTAVHELTHILGIAKSSGVTSWNRLISGGKFNGPKAKEVYGNRSVPVDSGLGHLKEGVKYDGLEVSMDPSLTAGTRKFTGPLDFAVLDDIGWSISTSDDTIYRAKQTLTHIPDPVLGTSDSTTLIGQIGSSNKDVDIYRIYAEEGSRLSVSSRTTNFDSYLKLFNAAGTLVASGDQAASSGTDRLSYTLPRSDYYFIGVSSYGNSDYDPFVSSSGPGGSTGQYTLGITLDDPSSLRSADKTALATSSAAALSVFSASTMFTSTTSSSTTSMPSNSDRNSAVALTASPIADSQMIVLSPEDAWVDRSSAVNPPQRSQPMPFQSKLVDEALADLFTA